MDGKLLGYTCKDLITGFSGVVTGYVRYLSGCNQYLVTPPVDKDGKRRDGEWFDEQRLSTDAKKAPITLNNQGGSGFDQAPPQR